MGLISTWLTRATGSKFIGKGLEYGMYTLPGIQEYQQSRQEGHGGLNSAIKGFGDMVLWNEFTFPMMALQIAPLAPLALQSIRNWYGKQEQKALPMSPYRYQDTPYAATSRQRALEAIEGSRMNARQFIGAEGGIMATRYR